MRGNLGRRITNNDMTLEQTLARNERAMMHTSAPARAQPGSFFSTATTTCIANGGSGIRCAENTVYTLKLGSAHALRRPVGRWDFGQWS